MMNRTSLTVVPEAQLTWHALCASSSSSSSEPVCPWSSPPLPSVEVPFQVLLHDSRQPPTPAPAPPPAVAGAADLFQSCRQPHTLLLPPFVLASTSCENQQDSCKKTEIDADVR